MTRKNKTHKSFFAAVLILSLLSATACTKHYANAVTQDQPAAARSSKGIADMLPGTWKLDRLEIPGLTENAASFGSQADRDAQGIKLAKYQDALKGLTVTFKDDATYLTVYNGQSDVGTWKVSTSNNLETMSKVTGNSSLYENAVISGNALTVKYNPGDGYILMTLLKQ